MRQCQLLAGALVPPTDALVILPTAWQTIRCLPECPGSSEGYAFRAMTGIAVHVFDMQQRSCNGTQCQRGPAELSAVRALEFVLSNYTNRTISLRDTASALNLSPSHLCRTIHTISGYTFLTHLGGVRVLAASCLLAGTGSDIAKIALQCGYHHTGELDRDFRRWLHASPRRYRKEVCATPKRVECSERPISCLFHTAEQSDRCRRSRS
jgi:AraC-like DNA-binding protein